MSRPEVDERVAVLRKLVEPRRVGLVGIEHIDVTEVRAWGG